VGVVWGLISALGFGSADFIARGVSIRLTAYHALFYIHLVSGILLFVVMLVDGIPASATTGAVGLGALLGAVNTLGTLMLYRGLSIGKISIVSPVTSAFGGISLVLALLAGDAIPVGGVFSLVLMLVGIVIVSSVRDQSQQDAQSVGLKGLPEAVIAALAFGLNFWALQFVVAPLGPYIPTLIGRIITVILLPLLARPLRQSVALPPRGLWLNIGVVGFVTTIGEIAYNVGVQGTTPGIVAILSSLFSPVTVLLALIFLRERLARHQWIGVGIIFIATLLLGFFQYFG
jgi:drug/metabolite transporter (DMT)-like permease